MKLLGKVKLLVEKITAASGAIEDRFPVNIIKARVKQDGDRAVDSAEFTIPIKDEIKIGDRVKYIQDDVETENLAALWNFNCGTRDESGYRNDGDDGTHTATLSQKDSSEEWTSDVPFVVKVNGASQKITIANQTHILANEGSPITPNVLDFSKQFDIFLRFKDLGFPNNNEVVFSKRNATDGIEIGITTSHKPYVDITSSSSTQTITGTTSVDDDYHLVRVRRDAAGLVQLFVDGVEEGTSITDTADLTVTSNGYFGADYLGAQGAEPVNFGMVRIYVKGNLNDTDADTLLNNFRQPHTMKFSGIVWKIKEKTHSKVVYCKGDNKLFAETELNKNILDARDESGSSNGEDNIFLTTGGSPLTTETILNQILNEVDSEYLVCNVASTSTARNFIGTGNLLTNIQLLLLADNDGFYTLPRKILVLEDVSDGDTTNILFENGRYEITETGEDDSTMVNDLEVVSDAIHKTKLEEFDGTGAKTEFVLAKEPESIIRISIGGTVQTDSDYTVTRRDKTVTFGSAPASGSRNVAIEYKYVDDTANVFLSRSVDNTSINSHGRKSKRLDALGIVDTTDKTSIATNYITNNKTANKRLKVVAPSLLNSVRINHGVQIVNENLGINYTTGETPIDSVKIKSIEWLYPEGKTIMMCGEHQFDSYDLDKFTTEVVRGTSQRTLGTQTL